MSLAVAVILSDAGLGLELGNLRGHTRRVVIRLITWGVAITWAFAALLLGMSTGAALMTGAILVVSGPTVIPPLLRFIRPTERLRRVLAWEGSLIEPVGGISGAVVYAAVAAGAHKGLAYQLGEFLITVGIGLAGTVIGVTLLWFLLRKPRLGEVLGTSAQLACVVGVAAACDTAREDAGLLAGIVMGLAVANMEGFDIPPGGRSSRRWCS